MEPSWKALLPFLVVIPISIWTKQVIPGLFVGLLVGSYFMTPSLLGGLRTMLHYVVDNLMQTNNIRIIIFLYVFAGLVSMIKYTGGIKGFVHLVSKKVKSAKTAMLLTWISTMVTFSDPDFRIAQQIGFAIEVTSNPVVALIPIATAFVGYMVSVIDKALDTAGIGAEPYIVYVRSIPFNAGAHLGAVGCGGGFRVFAIHYGPCQRMDSAVFRRSDFVFAWRRHFLFHRLVVGDVGGC